MQRLYFNFQKGDVRLVSLEVCPSIEDETSFPNADIPDDVTMEMISFKAVEGRLDPVITYPSIPITPQPESGGSNGQP
jgi:hypothetical protein